MDAANGSYFDGSSSRRRQVTVAMDDGALAIVESGMLLASWPVASLEVITDRTTRLILASRSDSALARLLIVDGETIAAIRAILPDARTRARTARRGNARLVLTSIAAAFSLAAASVLLLPLIAARLTLLVPIAYERRLGDAVYGQVTTIFGHGECRQDRNPSGAALAVLFAQLRSAAGLTPDDVSLVVLRSPVANALALPGGRIIVLEKLINMTQTPDELAGVLAHEIGHVVHRDGMRLLIENGGAGFILGTVLGDYAGASAILLGARALTQAAHSRDAERAADDFAVDIMLKLRRSPAELGRLLIRMTGAGGGGLLSSHPSSLERMKAMEAIGVEEGEPLLSPSQWFSLRQICGWPG